MHHQQQQQNAYQSILIPPVVWQTGVAQNDGDVQQNFNLLGNCIYLLNILKLWKKERRWQEFRVAAGSFVSINFDPYQNFQSHS